VATSRTDVQAKLLLASGSVRMKDVLTDGGGQNAIDRFVTDNQYIVYHEPVWYAISPQRHYGASCLHFADVDAGEKLVVTGNFTKAAGLFQQASDLAHRVMLLLEAQAKIGPQERMWKITFRRSNEPDGTSLDTSKDEG